MESVVERFRNFLEGRKILFAPGEGRTAPALAEVAPTATSMQTPAPQAEPSDPALSKIAPSVWKAIGQTMPWSNQVETPTATGGETKLVPQTRDLDILQGPGGARGISLTGADPSMANPPTGTASWTPALAGAAPTATALRMGLYPGAPSGRYSSLTGKFTSTAEDDERIRAQVTRERAAKAEQERAEAPEREAMANMMAYTGALIASRNPEQMVKGFALRKAFTESLGKQIVIPKGGAVARGGTIEVVNPEIQERGAKGGGGSNLPQGRESAVWRIAFNQAIGEGKSPLDAIAFADSVANQSIQSGSFARGTGRTEAGYGPKAQGLKAGTEEARKKGKKWGTR